MKNLLKTILLLFIMQVGLSSCKKQLVDKYEQSQKTTVATKTEEIKAASNFKWNTTSTLTVNFNPLTGDSRIAVLKVTAEDGSVITQKLQKASESHTFNLDIPSHYSKVNVIFGTNTKQFDTKTGKIDMSLN